jgi:hypothetical protein
MFHPRLVRDYENEMLPFERRLPSLARRFDCLKDAQGLEPWNAEALHAWTLSVPVGSAAWHAGHLILNLSGPGPWARVDIIAAMRVLGDEDRKTLATWVLSWR